MKPNIYDRIFYVSYFVMSRQTDDDEETNRIFGIIFGPTFLTFSFLFIILDLFVLYYMLTGVNPKFNIYFELGFFLFFYTINLIYFLYKSRYKYIVKTINELNETTRNKIHIQSWFLILLPFIIFLILSIYRFN